MEQYGATILSIILVCVRRENISFTAIIENRERTEREGAQIEYECHCVMDSVAINKNLCYYAAAVSRANSLAALCCFGLPRPMAAAVVLFCFVLLCSALFCCCCAEFAPGRGDCWALWAL